MSRSNATIYDIAKISGASPTTVSRVLSNKGYPVSEEMRRRVLDAALQIGYHPGKRAAKKVGSSPIVYVVVPSIANPYYLQLTTGVEQVLGTRKDIKMVLFNTGGSQDAEREFAADIAYNSRNCLGVIIASISRTHDHLLQLQYAGVRMVAFDQQINLNCHMVQFNYREGGRLAARHLIDTGCTRIGFIGSPLTRFSRREVYAGFCDTLHTFGLKPDQRCIKIAAAESLLPDSMYDFNNGVMLVRQLIDEGNLPDGLLCINDITATGVLRALRAARIRVPERVSVIGFDNIFISQIVTPRLTTIDQCTLEMGSLAAYILLNSNGEEGGRINRTMLEPSLIVRESTRQSTRRIAMTRTFRKDNLCVRQFATREEMGEQAAKDAAEAIINLLGEQPRVSVMFAAAPSQSEFLAALSADSRIDWSRVTAMQLDEYMGFDPRAPQGFARFLLDRIFLEVSPGSCMLMRCDCEDIEDERLRYARLLEENPLDLAFIGIGENGHIAFNDPGECDFNDTETVRKVVLSLKSREQQVNDGCFGSLDEVPQSALTVTVPAIMAAKKILCMVPASSKAPAVYDTLNASISEHCPATVLRRHRDATLYIETDSAALLR
ncbi:MAG: substrate-binding domain-containing protein [Defluviitaleaceae bacterium]|nr:substrate-binding domain-containing protein [Defluviitaleaceae bacterium]